PGAHHSFPTRRSSDLNRVEGPVAELEAMLGEQAAQVVVQRRDAIVVESRCGGAEHRHVRRLLPERLAVANQLAPDVAERVLGTRSEEHTSELQSRENL